MQLPKGHAVPPDKEYAKPWDELRRAAPIGCGQFLLVNDAVIHIRYISCRGCRLAIKRGMDLFNAPACRQMAAFLTELAEQFEGDR